MNRIVLNAAITGIMLAAGVSCALDLKLEVDDLRDNCKIDKHFVLKGKSYNADAEDPTLTPNGLRAFYYNDYSAYSPIGGTPYPLGDTTNTWWQGGRNSEFATNASNFSSWWIADTAQWRADNGIPGTATEQWHPPYILSCILQDVDDPDDDRVDHGDTYCQALFGRMYVPEDTYWNFSSGGDDFCQVYLDGRLAYSPYFSQSKWNPVFLSAGMHSISLPFVEKAGGQYYSASIPNNATLYATAPDEIQYFGYTVECGHWLQGPVTNALTLKIVWGCDGSDTLLAPLSFFYGQSSENYLDFDLGPSPVPDTYRMIMAGYWNVPEEGDYAFTGGADDRIAFAISEDVTADPWTIANVLSSETGTTSSAIHLTAGWHPVRIEFGENYGGANWSLYYATPADRINDWNYMRLMYPADFRSTADRGFVWDELANSCEQLTDTGVFVSTNLSAHVGERIDIRVTARGFDLSEVSQTYTNLLVVDRVGTQIFLR